MCVYVGGCLGLWVCTPDWTDLKLGTIVVLDTMSQPTDFGLNGQGLVLGLQSRRRFASPESAHYAHIFLLVFVIDSAILRRLRFLNHWPNFSEILHSRPSPPEGFPKKIIYMISTNIWGLLMRCFYRSDALLVTKPTVSKYWRNWLANNDAFTVISSTINNCNLSLHELWAVLKECTIFGPYFPGCLDIRKYLPPTYSG